MATADRGGVTLAARAGLDPYGMVAVLQLLRAETPQDPLFSLMLNTHPPAQMRLDQIETAMGQRMDSLPYVAPVTIAERLHQAEKP